MTCALIHLNPHIFPSPYSFQPERWLENPRLDRYLVSFSKGARQCLGINLAYAELYLCVAGVWRRYDGFDGATSPPNPAKVEGTIKLFETTKEDVEIKYDLFVPFAKRDSKGIRVLIE
jgi:cytochrome P450